MSENLLEVRVDGGKYEVIMASDGRLYANRYGNFWRDLVGDKLIYSLASTVDSLRTANAELVDHLEKTHAELQELSEKLRVLEMKNDT